MHPVELRQGSELLDEVGNVLEQLCLKYPKVFDELQIRYPLADELGGLAAMLRDHAQSMERDATKQTKEVLRKVSSPRSGPGM